MEKKIPNRRSLSKTCRQSRKRPGCIRLFVCPTTGGRLEISVSPQESILGLKAALARKLRTSPARITLIFREKVLSYGRIIDHNIPENSQLVLLPNMESGLNLHPSEKSITQALENLTETQVNDFLSGRAPLMLAIRMGEHMVFVQLQLSTLQSLGGQNQPRPQVSPVTPTSATLLSQSGLSASALAQATRCLSQRIHRLQSFSRPGQIPPRPQTTSSQTTNPVAALPNGSTTNPSTSATSVNPLPPASRSNPLSTIPPPLAMPPLASTSRPPASEVTSASAGSLPSPPPSPGAVIDSMKHLGSGIYSGTFSGTLDPSLQDTNGQPRRSVNTILHILNDLLVASPNNSLIGQSPTQAQGKGPTTPPSIHQGANLTPPPSPKAMENSGCAMPDNSDNVLLRDKMQRVQMMLAQRKEHRRKRRQMTSPYCPQKNSSVTDSSVLITNVTDMVDNDSCGSPQNTENISSASSSSSNPVSSSSSSPSPSTSADRQRLCSHVDGNKECCSSYCAASSLEQDSLAV